MDHMEVDMFTLKVRFYYRRTIRANKFDPLIRSKLQHFVGDRLTVFGMKADPLMHRNVLNAPVLLSKAVVLLKLSDQRFGIAVIHQVHVELSRSPLQLPPIMHEVVHELSKSRSGGLLPCLGLVRRHAIVVKGIEGT